MAGGFNSGRARRVTRTGSMRLPISGDPYRHIFIDTPAAMASAEWSRMLEILNFFRPGLVQEDPEPGDTYSI